MVRFEFRRLFLLAVLAAAVSAAACGDDNNAAGPAPTPPVVISSAFTGTVTVNGAVTHPFDVSRAGTVTVQVTALSPDDTVTIGVALGTWNGAACQLVIPNDAATLSTTVLGTATAPGTLCVRVSDVGKLKAPTDYEVKVDHY